MSTELDKLLQEAREIGLKPEYITPGMMESFAKRAYELGRLAALHIGEAEPINHSNQRPVIKVTAAMVEAINRKAEEIEASPSASQFLDSMSEHGGDFVITQAVRDRLDELIASDKKGTE